MGKSGNQDKFGGDWTVIKLDILKKYLKAYTIALQNQSFRLVYIDSFAGTGRCDVKIGGDRKLIDGSARIALQNEPPFSDYWFIEQSAKKVSELQTLKDEYPVRNVQILRADANEALLQVCREYDWRSNRAVLFLDPFGMEVAWPTLVEIARTKAIDVWYLFPYSALYRQAPNDPERLDADKEAALTRCLGTDEWRQAFYTENPQQKLFGEAGEIRHNHKALLEYVSSRLKGLFSAVPKPRLLYQEESEGKPKGAPLFALYFAVASDNPKAIGLATKLANYILRSS